MDGITKQVGKVNWVVCPKCKYRFYCGPPVFYVEGIPAICPECRHEFNAWEALEPRFTGKSIFEKKT